MLKFKITLNKNLQMNLGQRDSDNKLRLRNTGMKHYKCLAFERQGLVYKNSGFLALSNQLCLEFQTSASYIYIYKGRRLAVTNCLRPYP
jgi:hypothetical protein